jgi:hypothetical protein
VRVWFSCLSLLSVGFVLHADGNLTSKLIGYFHDYAYFNLVPFHMGAGGSEGASGLCYNRKVAASSFDEVIEFI